MKPQAKRKYKVSDLNGTNISQDWHKITVPRDYFQIRISFKFVFNFASQGSLSYLAKVDSFV